MNYELLLIDYLKLLYMDRTHELYLQMVQILVVTYWLFCVLLLLLGGLSSLCSPAICVTSKSVPHFASRNKLWALESYRGPFQRHSQIKYRGDTLEDQQMELVTNQPVNPQSEPWVPENASGDHSWRNAGQEMEFPVSLKKTRIEWSLLPFSKFLRDSKAEKALYGLGQQDQVLGAWVLSRCRQGYWKRRCRPQEWFGSRLVSLSVENSPLFSLKPK